MAGVDDVEAAVAVDDGLACRAHLFAPGEEAGVGEDLRGLGARHEVRYRRKARYCMNLPDVTGFECVGLSGRCGGGVAGVGFMPVIAVSARWGGVRCLMERNAQMLGLAAPAA